MIYAGSRYANAYVFLDEGKDSTFLGFIPTFIPVTQKDKVYQFQSGDRLDLLAHKFWGNAQLKWLLLHANPQYMTEFDIQVGDIINVPSLPEGII